MLSPEATKRTIEGSNLLARSSNKVKIRENNKFVDNDSKHDLQKRAKDGNGYKDSLVRESFIVQHYENDSLIEEYIYIQR